MKERLHSLCEKFGKYFLKTAPLSIILLSFVCQYSIVTEVYVSEIFEIANGIETKQAYSNAELRFSVPSEAKCLEDKEYLISTLSDYFGEIKNAKCATSNLEGYFQGSVKIPIILAKGNQITPVEGLFNVTIAKGDLIRVGLFLNTELFDHLQETIQAKYFNTLKIEEFSLGISVINDTKNKINAEVLSVYIEQEPVPGIKKFEMAPRSKTNIVLSNVLRDSFYVNGASDFLYLESKQKVK
ncbi:DUF7424 family protein [Leptospira idonii]|uniref:DUF7424 domain-containing protein n=1 Tax=Leptospira idonii TaxID=1193500 RepID=A0A4R9M3C6_9LEPT|nr:hypothetical protein [Leptospira idonii]TGN20481.1 hypothetical protein EHS15_04540 [Leptospira idonii]